MNFNSLDTRKLAGLILAAVALLALAGYAAHQIFFAPAPGRVLDFKVTEASIDGPSRAWFVVADVAFEAGTPDDFAATAVAIAAVVPADNVIVAIERNDIPSSAGHWRRLLARAEYVKTDKKPLAVRTPVPLLSAKEIAASMEYTERAGLALTSDGEPLSSEMDDTLVKSLAAKHGVRADRVGLFTPLRTERGDRSDWVTLDGPGSKHLSELAGCYASTPRGTDAWKACR